MIRLRFIILYFCLPGVLFSSHFNLDLQRELLLLSAGSGLTVTTYFLSEQDIGLSEQSIARSDREDVNWVDRSATFNESAFADNCSDVMVVLCATSPALVFMSEEIRGEFQNVSIIYAETFLLALSLPDITKRFVERKRPFVYNSEVNIKEKLKPYARRSFFSGHSTIAFSSAMFTTYVYSVFFPESLYKNYIAVGSFTAASLTAFLRYESGRHYPTDILTGAVIGSAIGYLIPSLHRNADLGITFNYTINEGNNMVSVNYRF